MSADGARGEQAWRRLRVVAVVLLLALVVFEAALAFGAPWGRGAWGGQFPGKLPVGLRWASAATACFYLALALTAAGPPRRWRTVVLTVSAVLTGFSTVANMLSESRWENLVWTPIAAVLTVLLLGLAAQRRTRAGTPSSPVTPHTPHPPQRSAYAADRLDS